MKQILNHKEINLIIRRLAHEIVENHENPDKLVIVGIQPRGVLLSDRLIREVNALYDREIPYGLLDITFYRDDFRNEMHLPNKTRLNMGLEGKEVVIVDDVLYTGRTIRAALDALLDFGRPAKVSLCVLVDRKFHREIPIQPDYFGRAIDTIFSQKVIVNWANAGSDDEVGLVEREERLLH